MLNVGERIRECREKLDMTQDELAQLTGYKSRSSINKIEKGGNDLPQSKIVAFAKALKTTPSYLMGWEDELPTEVPDKHIGNIYPVKLKSFPLLGSIACGEPIFAEESRQSAVMADMDINADFCLRAQGDSMINARIHDGDIVFIKEMPIVDNGEIAAVVIEDEATLKRVYYDKPGNVLQLVAENPRYAPLVYSGEELDHIHILGKAVYFMSAL
jgi:repressor LexA